VVNIAARKKPCLADVEIINNMPEPRRSLTIANHTVTATDPIVVRANYFAQEPRPSDRHLHVVLLRYVSFLPILQGTNLPVRITNNILATRCDHRDGKGTHQIHCCHYVRCSISRIYTTGGIPEHRLFDIQYQYHCEGDIRSHSTSQHQGHLHQPYSGTIADTKHLISLSID
jgi:hypothetical protein